MNSTPRGYRTGNVVLEDEPSLPAFLPEDGRNWNGFELPIFDPAVIAEHREALAKMFPAEPDNEDALVLTWNGDRPSIVDPQYADDPDGGEYVIEVDIEGQTFLSIGGGAFVWSEAEDDDEASDDEPAEAPLVNVVINPTERAAASVILQESTVLLADAIREVSEACERHDVDGYDGEAVSYLSALLRMVELPGISADDAVIWAYGIKAEEVAQ